MRRIYSLAIGVLAWIGPGRDCSNEGLRVLKQMEGYRKPNMGTDHFIKDVLPEMLYHSGSWSFCSHILECLYWRRGWIVQETVLSKRDSKILCGTTELSLHTLPTL